MMNTTYRRVIGVDIASEKIDINDSHAKLSGTLANSLAAMTAGLVAKVQDKEDTLVACEATGGYEHALVDVCHAAGIPVAVANPSAAKVVGARPKVAAAATAPALLWTKRRRVTDADREAGVCFLGSIGFPPSSQVNEISRILAKDFLLQLVWQLGPVKQTELARFRAVLDELRLATHDTPTQFPA